MTIEIKLDNANLDILFPEGSDARAKLTKNVAENFLSSRLQAGVTNAVRQDLDAKLATIRKSAVAAAEEHFLAAHNTHWSRSWQPTESLKKIIREAIGTQVELMVSEAMREQLAKVDFQALLARKAETALRQYTEGALTTMLQERMKTALAAAMLVKE